MATANDAPIVRSDRDLDLWRLAMDTVGATYRSGGGSVAEVETDLAIGVALDYVNARALSELNAQLDRRSKILFGLYRSLDA
jgi:hypothetical protein